MHAKSVLNRIIVLIMCASIILGCVSCRKNEANDDGVSIVKGEGEITASFFAFDTYMSISVRAVVEGSGNAGGEDTNVKGTDGNKYKDNGLINEEQMKTVINEVRRLEKIFSATDPAAEIYKIDHREEDTVAISGEVAELVSFAKDMYAKTDGALDVTSYPLLKAWGFTLGKYRIPEEDELKDLLKAVGMERVSIVEDTVGKFILNLEPYTELDFGAVAKGYLSRVIVGMLEEMGVKHALLDLGGNIVTIGPKPDGSDWKVGIKDPFGEKDMIGYVIVKGQSVVTSGGYERYFTDEDGTVYWHIIDPKTGYPARTGIISATIIGDDPLMCDALSTALFVMGPGKAEEYYDKFGGFEYVLVLDDGSIITSAGIADTFIYR